METNNFCPCCGGNVFEGLIAFDGMPRSGLFRSSLAEQLPHYTLEFELCLACGLVRQRFPVPSKDYAYIDRAPALELPGYVSELLAGLASHGVSYPDLILEVGSNNGSFLDILRRTGYTNLVGIEPSVRLAKYSRSKGFTTINDYFSPDCGAEIVRKFGRPSVIVCRHTVEHVPEPLRFMVAMRECLSEKGGVLLIELPDGSAIPELLNVYELWDEHLHYFSAENARLMLGQAGFSLTEARSYSHLDTRNLVLWAQLGFEGSDLMPAQSRAFAHRIEKWRQMPGAWRRVATALREKLESASRPVYAVGASHSQTNFFGFAGLSAMVEFMIDDDPHKLGKLPPMKGGAPVILSSSDFESRATHGTVVLSGFGYPKWAQRIRAHAEKAGMQVIDPGILKGEGL